MKLKIAVSIEIFYPQINGLVTTTMNLIRNFKELGHEVVIVTPKVLKNNPEEIDGIPIYYIPSSDALTYPGLRLVNIHHPMFKTIIEENEINIVQTTAPWFTGQGLHVYAKKKKHIPIINTFHTNLHNPGYMQYIAPFMMNKHSVKVVQKTVWNISRPFLEPCDVLVAPSPNTCNDLHGQFPHKRIEWIPNGVQIDMFHSPENTEFLYTYIPDILEKKEEYAIYIGRLAKEKSVDVLLDATAHVIKEIPNFKLVIVGDGPLKKKYLKQVDELQISENVYFLGKIEHDILLRSGLVHKARVFTTASVTETHSMTVTEALCCGVPIVASDHASMTYLVRDKGVFFKSMDPLAASKQIINMWQDEKLYKEKKEAATGTIKEFDGMSIAEKYIKLYMEILEIKLKKQNKSEKV